MGATAIQPFAVYEADRVSAVHVLARSGAEPLRFEGRRLFAVCNEADDRATWTEVDLYERAPGGGYVVAVRVVRGGLAAPDLLIARQARSLEIAAAIAAAVDPADGVSAEPWPPRPPGSPGRMLAVVAHRTRIAVLRNTHAELVRRAVALWGVAQPAPAARPPRASRVKPAEAPVRALQSLVAEEFGRKDSPMPAGRLGAEMAKTAPAAGSPAAPALAMLNAGANGAILAAWMAWSVWAAWASWNVWPQAGEPAASSAIRYDATAAPGRG